MIDVKNGIDVQKIKELLEQKKLSELKQMLSDLPAVDIAEILQELDEQEMTVIFLLLPIDVQSDVFSELDPEIQEEMIKHMADEQIKQLIEDLDPDDRTRLFEGLPSKVTRRLINLLSSDDRKEALRLLGYPEDSVGRLMTPDYVAVKKHWTIERAIEHIREYGSDAETIDMIYVIDDEWKLLDDIPIRRILLADPKDLVEKIMDYHFVSINVNADQEEAIKLIEKYNLVSLPVVDDEGHLLGIVTVDDIIDVLREEQTEDFMKHSAIEAETDELEFMTRLKDVPLFTIFKSRIGWLLALLVMDMITGGIIKSFENTIAKYVVLVTFLPVLIDTAGNAGSQAATLIIRALALGTVKMKDWLLLLGREFLVSAALGAVMAVGISFMGIYRGGSWHIAKVVIVSMFVNVIVGSMIGALLPFIFTKLKKDPATASTPLITTLADIIGTWIYLMIATAMLGI
jgi:magnesium transporter